MEKYACVSFTVPAQYKMDSAVVAAQTSIDCGEGIHVPKETALHRDRLWENSGKWLKGWYENGLEHKKQKYHSWSICAADDHNV